MKRLIGALLLALFVAGSVAAQQIYTLRLDLQEYTIPMDDLMIAAGLGQHLNKNPQYRLEGELLVITLEFQP
jgi:hypothetical protein